MIETPHTVGLTDSWESSHSFACSRARATLLRCQHCLVEEVNAIGSSGHILTESAMVQFAKTHSAAAFVTASLRHWQSISVSGHGPAGPLCITQLNWNFVNHLCRSFQDAVQRNKLTEHSGRP
jgi:hypothetical protein